MNASDIIWLIVIVGAVIFSTISKAKKQAADKSSGIPGNTGSGNPQGSEAWPSWDKSLRELLEQTNKPTAATPIPAQKTAPTPPTIQTATPPVTTALSTENQEFIDPNEAISLETDTGFEQAQRQSLRQAASLQILETPQLMQRLDDDESYRHLPQKRPTTPTTPHPTDTHPASNEIPEIITDFDLRAAVIYSALLQPKFQD